MDSEKGDNRTKELIRGLFVILMIIMITSVLLAGLLYGYESLYEIPALYFLSGLAILFILSIFSCLALKDTPTLGGVTLCFLVLLSILFMSLLVRALPNKVSRYFLDKSTPDKLAVVATQAKNSIKIYCIVPELGEEELKAAVESLKNLEDSKRILELLSSERTDAQKEAIKGVAKSCDVQYELTASGIKTAEADSKKIKKFIRRLGYVPFKKVGKRQVSTCIFLYLSDDEPKNLIKNNPCKLGFTGLT